MTSDWGMVKVVACCMESAGMTVTVPAVTDQW